MQKIVYSILPCFGIFYLRACVCVCVYGHLVDGMYHESCTYLLACLHAYLLRHSLSLRFRSLRVPAVCMASRSFCFVRRYKAGKRVGWWSWYAFVYGLVELVCMYV